MIDILWSVSFIFLGYSISYFVRAFKLKTRRIINYKEVMTDDPLEMHKMIERMTLSNRLMRGKVENLSRELEATRARRKAYVDDTGVIDPEIVILAEDDTPEGGKVVLAKDKDGYWLRFHGERVWKKDF